MISFNKLPSEYQQVEYIENTELSYINTGFTLNQDSKVEMVVYSTNFAQGHLFGSRESATSKNFTISDGHLDFGTYTKNRISFNSHADNLKTTLTIDKTTFKVDNESYNDSYQLISVDDFTCIAPAYIFYASGNPYGNYRVWGKLYSCKIWDNGTLVRNFIPCYRKSDDEVGLYDVVNNTFYTNAGTGTFSKGEDIVIKNIVINNKDVKKLEDINGNVWWEKSKGGNIFDPTTATILQAYFENGVPNITSNTGNRLTYVACKPNTTYKITKLLGKIFWIGCTVNEPDIGVATTSRQQGTIGTFDGTSTTSMTFTTDSTANYLAIRYTSIWTDGSANETTIFNSIEVYEQ